MSGDGKALGRSLVTIGPPCATSGGRAFWRKDRNALNHAQFLPFSAHVPRHIPHKYLIRTRENESDVRAFFNVMNACIPRLRR